MQAVSAPQGAGQGATLPPHREGGQLGLPAALAESTAQVPLVVAPAATVQASQAPAQAVLQHTPPAPSFTQKPVAHWLAAVQAAPLASLATQALEPLQ